jgi:hypothetical protein
MKEIGVNMVDNAEKEVPRMSSGANPKREHTNPGSVMRRSVNPYAFGGGVFGIILLTKAASYLTPYKLYFSFSSFLYSHRSVFRWEALILKLMVPVAVGFLLFYLPFQWMKLTKGSSVNYRAIYRYLMLQADLTAQGVGFFSALLLAWPFIVYWDVLMHPSLQSMEFPFLCVYFLYFISFAYFAGLGANLGRLAVHRELPAAATRQLPGKLSWVEAVRTSFMGIITSAIATYLASALGAAK